VAAASHRGQDGSRSLGCQPAPLRHRLHWNSADLPASLAGSISRRPRKPSPQRDRDRSKDARRKLEADRASTMLDVPAGGRFIPSFVRWPVCQDVVQQASHAPVAMRPPRSPTRQHALLHSAPAGEAGEPEDRIRSRRPLAQPVREIGVFPKVRMFSSIPRWQARSESERCCCHQRNNGGWQMRARSTPPIITWLSHLTYHSWDTAFYS
jgi:hypothetical protein